jgi:hypothetical protein
VRALFRPDSGVDLGGLTIDVNDRLFLNTQLVTRDYKTFIDYFHERNGMVRKTGQSVSLTVEPLSLWADSMNFLGRDLAGNWYWGDNTGLAVFSPQGDLIDYFMLDWEKHTIGRPHVAPNGDLYYLGRSEEWVSLYRVRNVWDRAFEVGVINDRNVRVRKNPSTSTESIGQLDKGIQLAVVGQTKETQTIAGQSAPWLYVRLADGREGWVFGAFVDLENR